MAINMANVKEIHYANKEIKKIEMNGNVVWQKPSAKVLQSITLAGYTTTFTNGSTFSFGGTVTANYSDSTTADVTSSTTFSGYNMNSNGTQTVTASYTEDGVTETATYQITVRQQVTATVSWNQTELSNNAVFTYDGTTSYMTKITWKTEAQVNSAIATKLSINASDIISKSNYSLTTRWGASSSGDVLYFKKSNSTSGSNWWSYTTTSSGQVYPKVTATPTWGATVYGAYKLSGTSTVTMVTTATAVKLRSVKQTGWAFSCSVTYWKYTN